MSEKSYYEQTDAQFKIRLPHELKDKIRASADEHNRTMTADIVARLEESFEHQVQLNNDVAAMLAIIQEQHKYIQDKQIRLEQSIQEATLQMDLKIQEVKEQQVDEWVAKITDEFEKHPQSSILNEILREIKSLKSQS